MERRKKILYLITKGNFGGAQRYVYDLATNLPQDKFETVVACGSGELLREKLHEANVRVIKIEGLEREVTASKDLKALKNLIKIIKEEKPDTIHLNSSKIGLLGSLAILYIRVFHRAYSNSIPIPHSIFTAHGWSFNEKSRSSFSRFIYYLGHYFTIIICDTTIAVSEKTKRDALCFPFVKNKIKVVYNGVDSFKISKKEEVRKMLSEADDKLIIFSISELHKNKGVDIAIKALSLLPTETRKKIIYCVAGSGEEKENLEKLASELSVSDMVRFLGFVPDAKNLLSGADIFLLPSRTEAFPYSLLEAGLAGIPVIATCVGGVPEVIKDMQNGILVHPRNPKEIAEAILYLLDHKDKQMEFKKEIKKTVTNFFSMGKMIENTVVLY